MRCTGTFSRGLRLGTFLLPILLSIRPLAAGEWTIIRTNWADRWITNLVEVRMPSNHFVTEYRTNRVTVLRTNFASLLVTNVATKTLTNRVFVDAFRTNVLTSYSTNWITVNHTNQVAVAQVRTNFVRSFETNWTTLNLTNWETVVVIRTNWITQPVTNFVQMDITSSGSVSAEVSSKESARPVEGESIAASPSSTELGNSLVLEATRTIKAPADNLVEVLLKVRWADNGAAPLLVEQWRIENADGSVTSFGSEREFKRQLPAGKYKVEVRVRRQAGDPVLAARGILALTAREATIQPRLTAKR